MEKIVPKCSSNFKCYLKKDTVIKTFKRNNLNLRLIKQLCLSF